MVTWGFCERETDWSKGFGVIVFCGNIDFAMEWTGLTGLLS